MSLRTRKQASAVGISVVLAVTVLATAWLRNESVTSRSRIPAAEQIYREWLRSIGSNETKAIESGLDLLSEDPDQPRVYVRLTDLCMQHASEDKCRVVLESLAPSTTASELYRAAAVLMLGGPGQIGDIAQSPDLDPALVRWLIDQLRKRGEADLLLEVEAAWNETLATDSMHVGSNFGLGYSSVLRNDWPLAVPYLRRTTVALRNDAHAFREFARIYFFTGDYERFVAALETALDNAKAANDIEHEIILLGNLGLGFLQWKGDLAKAEEMFASSYSRAKDLEMGRSIAIGGYRLASVHARQHRYDDALALLDAVEVWYQRDAPERLSELLALRGQILSNMFRFSEAERHIRAGLANAVANGDEVREAQLLLVLAQLGTKHGRYDQAYSAADSALALVTKLGARDIEISAHSVLGEVERLSGRYPAAQLHFRRGLITAEATDSPARIAEMSRELGVTALLAGDLDAATRHFEAAHEKAGKSDVDLADALYLTGNTFALNRNHELAVSAYRRALDAIRTPHTLLEGRIKLKLAHVENARGDLNAAAAALEDAAVILKRDPLQSALVHLVRGQVFLKMRAYADALQAFLDAQSDATWLHGQWEVHYGKGIASWGLGSKSRAEDSFREAIADIESKRDQVQTTAGRSYFFNDRIAAYHTYAAFLEEEGRVAEAINITERARSRGLLDLIYTTQKSRGAIEGETFAQAIDAVVRSRALETERAKLVESGDGDPARIQFMNSEQETLAETFARLEMDLRGSHPLFSFSPITSNRIQDALHPSEAVLAYSVRQVGYSDKPLLVVHIISPDALASITLQADPNELEHSVRSFNNAIRDIYNDDQLELRRKSRELYDQLIAPPIAHLDPSITHLHVIPSGVLNYLPFSALQSSQGSYLVERYTLSTSPSLTILALSRERNPGSWRNALIIADPDENLPGAQHEAQLITSLDTSSFDLALGPDATKELLVRESSKYDVIHLATHGEFDVNSPLSSHLKLRNEALNADQIGRLQLKAYLVTLSACETALSRSVKKGQALGDEWVGMHQAFLAAGTPTIVASLWKIHDRYSGPLMSRFYAELRSKGKSAALAQVQRGFIKDARLSHPYYWAGVVVIGDPL